MPSDYVSQSSQNPAPDAPDFNNLVSNAMGSAPDVSSSMPSPDLSSVPNLPSDQQMPQQAAYNPPDATNDAPQTPSLWRRVLAGALSGLAAGASVNTRGMSGGNAFAAGAGAGANQVLNVQPKQQADLDQEKAQTAFHYVQLAQAQRQLNTMPDNKREAFLSDAADTYSSMLKGGAVFPMSQPTDLVSAQQQLQQLHAKQPWAVYSVMPVRGNDGTMQYSAVQFGKAPTQEDIVLKGAGPNGSDLTIPAGTPSDQVGKTYTTVAVKGLEASTKKSIADNHDTTTLANTALKGQQAAAKAAANPNANMMVGSLSDGTQVAGTPEELKAAGVGNFAKLPAADVSKVITARGLVSHGGLYDAVAADMTLLNSKGQLGAAASRWNDFLANKVGSGNPDFARLSTDVSLLQTAIMQAHVGAKGGNEMLEHFKSTVGDPSISDAATLVAKLQASRAYMVHKAMLPKKGGQ